MLWRNVTFLLPSLFIPPRSDNYIDTMQFQIGHTTSIPTSLPFQALEDMVRGNEMTMSVLRMDVTRILLNPESHEHDRRGDGGLHVQKGRLAYLCLQRENAELRNTIQERKLRMLEQENMELSRAILDEMLKLLHKSQAALWMLDNEMKHAKEAL